MTYKNPEMPPVIRRDTKSHYQLEGQSGVVIAEFNTASMVHPAGWWSELVTAMKSEYSDPMDLAHDLTLLSAAADWEFVDETVDQ